VSRKERPKGDTTWKDLLALARAADPDDWRTRLRDAWARKDGKALRQLAASAQASELPPSTLALVGDLLEQAGAVEQAEDWLRRAQQRHPADFWINQDLALLLQHQAERRGQRSPRWDQAIRFQTAAVALRPRSPGVYVNLGFALLGKGALDEAITAYKQAIDLNPDYAVAHGSLGGALLRQGKLAEVEAAYRKAIDLKADYAEAYTGLGNALQDQGKPAEAEAACRRAIALKHDGAEAHNNLGVALADKGRLDEAMAEYREALRLKKDFPEAHAVLGFALLQQGRLGEAVEELRLGHEHGSHRPGWHHPSAQWLRDAERLAELDVRLPALLKGSEQPKDAGERLALAQLCQRHRNHYAAAARWYGESFAAQPALAEDLRSGHRYNAACAAALTGCGQGMDAQALAEAQRARLRQQALSWLRRDLGAWRAQLEQGTGQARAAVVKQMQH
jgi:tetratricopeptide (TPR) repeat protein